MSKKGNGGLFASASIFYGVLLINYELPQLSTTTLGRTLLLAIAFLSWTGALIGFYRTALSDWVLTLLALIPLEFSNPFIFVRSFSPIDYLGLAAVLGLLMRSDWPELWRKILSTFGTFVTCMWLAFFTFAVIAGLCLHGNPLKDFRWVLFLFAYFYASEAASSTSRRDFLSEVIFLISVLGALIGSLSLFQFVHNGMDFREVTATFRQHNSVGAFLSLCLPLSVSSIKTIDGKPRTVRFILALLCLGGFLVSYSRGAWTGLIAGLLLVYGVPYLRRSQSKRVILLAVLVLMAGVFARHFLRHDLNGRNLYWRAGIQVLRSHPIVGLGPGNYSSHIQAYLSGNGAQLYREDVLYHHRLLFWIHLHNLYLQILVEHGLLGGLLFFLALAGLVRKAFGRVQGGPAKACRVSIIGFLVHNLVDITAVNSFDILFGVLIALANVEVSDKSFANDSLDNPH